MLLFKNLLVLCSKTGSAMIFRAIIVDVHIKPRDEWGGISFSQGTVAPYLTGMKIANFHHTFAKANKVQISTPTQSKLIKPSITTSCLHLTYKEIDVEALLDTSYYCGLIA